MRSSMVCRAKIGGRLGCPAGPSVAHGELRQVPDMVIMMMMVVVMMTMAMTKTKLIIVLIMIVIVLLHILAVQYNI